VFSGDAVLSGGLVYAFTSEQRVRISTLMVTPTHVGVSGCAPMPLVDLIEVTGDRAGHVTRAGHSETPGGRTMSPLRHYPLVALDFGALFNFISFRRWQNERLDEQVVVFSVPMPRPIDA
jgi:hypothetical protein